MTVFLTDNSLTGICSALFFAFTEKIFPGRVEKSGNTVKNFNDVYIEIENDGLKSQRVLTALKRYGGAETVENVKICLLSCDDNALKTAFDFCRKMLDERKNVSLMLADKRVSDFYYTVKKVLGERHKFTGFIRFKETARGVLYAPYSPDNDLTELLCPHFIKRLPFTPFVIHDVKRQKVGVSDGKNFRIMRADTKAILELSDDEKAWEDLWKRYYKSVNIKERKNKKQQDGLMPVRYRKFLPETYE